MRANNLKAIELAALNGFRLALKWKSSGNVGSVFNG